MRHYRCRDCGEGFSVEPLSDVKMRGEVHCVFCGGSGRAILDLMHGVLTTPAGRERIAAGVRDAAERRKAAVA